jgi:hypothetical protein
VIKGQSIIHSIIKLFIKQYFTNRFTTAFEFRSENCEKIHEFLENQPKWRSLEIEYPPLNSHYNGFGHLANTACTVYLSGNQQGQSFRPKLRQECRAV